MADACKICYSVIQGKHYRTLSTKANIEKYSVVLGSLGVECQGKLCNICVNKLNKIVNLKGDIIEKQKKCERDVQVIFGELQRMPGASIPLIPSSVTCNTPKNTPKHGMKRQRTPQTPSMTPRSKKSLFVTPPKLSIHRDSTSATQYSVKTVPRVSVGTQTKACSQEFDVKVRHQSCVFILGPNGK